MENTPQPTTQVDERKIIAINDQAKPITVIGEKPQEWFKGIQ
ncbi:MAG TPA: hypothetical protein VKA08_14155 [Balneolales bacterium]|nr:hypothetical protein [Balneolales bacterium]